MPLMRSPLRGCETNQGFGNRCFKKIKPAADTAWEAAILRIATSMDRVECVIVGAGVIGLAGHWRLARRPRSGVLEEAEARHGTSPRKDR